MNENLSNDEKLVIQSVLESTRTKLAQVTLMNADLEGLLALERQKNKELLELLQKEPTSND